MVRRPDSDQNDGTLFEPLLVVIGLTLLVSLGKQAPIWDVPRGLLALSSAMGAAYLAGYMALRRSRSLGLRYAPLITMVATQPVLLAWCLLGPQGSRRVLVAELSLVFFFVALAGSSLPARLRVVAAVLFVGLTAYPSLAAISEVERGDPGAPPPEVEYVFTSYQDLSLTSYQVTNDPPQDGGALALLPAGQVLLVAGDGLANILDFEDGLEATPVDLHIPLDVAAYRASPRSSPQFYRVLDVEYLTGRLLVTYTHWNRSEDCYTLRLIEADFDGSVAGDWETRFESQPCVQMEYMNNETGGRLAVVDSSHVLLTIGTFTIEYRDYADWRRASDYGRILALDLDSGAYETVSVGHRNPQGLLVAGGRIWSTEHGPQGGDELNLIQRGSDYGWPFVSYGTDYGKKTLHMGGDPGQHSGYAEPVYAWIPSIGVSNLIQVSSGLFPLWKGDLLVASLSGLGNGMALFRLRLIDDRPVSVERIPAKNRVRDLIELPDGPLVLWDGLGGIRVLRPADYVFSACTGCHSIRKAQHGIGPDLWGVVGSPVARHEEFQYSAAMRQQRGRWTNDRLDRFLADPQREIPGTSMSFEGVPDPATRAEIIRFLQDIGAGRP